MRRVSIVTLCIGKLSTEATNFWISVGFWVDEYTSMPPSSAGSTEAIWVSR
ncbi:hypothetical protein D3C78_1679770 [compost metagenome]